MSDWKPVKDENPSYKCKKCNSDNVWYYEIDNDYGDIKYNCKDCNAVWYYEGSDY